MDELHNSITRGRILEIAVVERLSLDGWVCWRTAASRGTGAVDIVCAQPGKLALLTVSIKQNVEPFDRTRLIQMAQHLNAEAVEVVQSRGRMAFICLWPEGNRQWGNLPIPEQLIRCPIQYSHTSLTTIGVRILGYLVDHPMSTSGEIADEMDVNINSVGPILLHNLDKGKVTRTDTRPARWSVVDTELS